MDTKKLGLPIEYQKFPQYFDAHNIGDDTEAKNAVIAALLKKHNVQTVLDLTCGTGSQVFFLTKQGYQVTGADFSPALLEQARKRARNENIPVTFIDGDMRSLTVGSFDAVITIFNAVGHLTKADFKKTMRNISENLKPGGIYVFDILNAEAMSKEVVAGLAWQAHKKVDDSQMLTSQCSTFDQERGILVAYESYMIQKQADKPEQFTNTFSLQIYAAKELREMLDRNSFGTLAHYAMDGSAFVANKSLSILTIARKK